MLAFTKLRTIIALLILASFSSLTLYIHLIANKVLIHEPPFTKKPLYFVKWKENELISCHYVTGEDVLPSAEDASFSPPEDSIFFHVTSCRGGLNSRQACAVEAAAAAHPDREVYVLFSGPVSELLLTRTCLATLNHFSNVHFARVHIDEYAKGTVFEEFIARRTNHRSNFPVEHTSDILRFLTLYKWGGIYLDTDMLVMKSLDVLGKNWVARQSDYTLNVAALAIGRDETGKLLAQKLLNELRIDFKEDERHYSGFRTIRKVLTDFCNTTDISKFSAETCRGFEVYKPKVIYPVELSMYDGLFDHYHADQLYDFDSARTVHLWNERTHNKAFMRGTLMDNLVRDYCPYMYHIYEDEMATEQRQYKVVPD